jgi:biotin operon repressor
MDKIDMEIMNRKKSIAKIKSLGYKIVSVKNRWKLLDKNGILIDETFKGCFKYNAFDQFIKKMVV